MGKTAKKKAKKEADFTRTKTKVGRKVQPQAATDTAFSAKAVGLPTQSITVEKATKYVTKRKHSLDDLLPMLGHSKEAARKDSLQEIEELFVTFPQLLPISTHKVLPAVSPLMTDRQGPVRKALAGFLNFYFERVPPMLLEPFYNTLILHVQSALSNIDRDVRADAIKLLDLFLDTFPSVIARDAFGSSSSSQSNGRSTLACLAPFLQVSISSQPESQTATSSMTPFAQMPMTSRADLLRAFDKFIYACLSHQGVSTTEEQEWFFAAGFERGEDAMRFLQGCKGHSAPFQRVGDDRPRPIPITTSSCLAKPDELFHDASTSLKDTQAVIDELLSSTAPETSSASTSVTPVLLYQRLQQQLLNTYVEVARNCFMSGPTTSALFDASLEIIYRCLSMTCQLFRASLPEMQASSSAAQQCGAQLLQMLKTAAQHFPYEQHDHLSGKPTNVINTLRRTSALFAETASLLALALAPHSTSTNKCRRISEEASKVLDIVAEYLQSFLDDDSDDKQIVCGLEPLLPTLWMLLDSPKLSEDKRSSCYSSLLLRANNPSTNQAPLRVRAALFDFLAKIWLVRDAQGYVGHAGQLHAGNGEISTALQQWMDRLPRLLWEAANDKQMSIVAQRILLFLHKMAINQRMPCSTSDTLLVGLAPYFASKKREKIVLGPYGKADAATQSLAVQTVSVLTSDFESPACDRLKQAVILANKRQD